MAHLHQALEKSKHLESAAVNTGDVTFQTGEILQRGMLGQECPLSCSTEHGGLLPAWCPVYAGAFLP